MNKESEGNVKYNLFMNMILLLSQYIYPLISFPYISRILNADGIGKVSFALSFVSYFSIFASLGIPTYGIRCVAKTRDNQEEFQKIVQELIIINIFCTGICTITYLATIFIIPTCNSDILLFLIAGINMILSALNLQWLYQGLEQYAYITKRTILVRTLSLVFILLAINSKDDYIYYAIGSVMTEAGNALFNLIHARKLISFRISSNLNFQRHFKPILIFFSSSVATTIYNHLDVVMIGFIKDSVEVGYYSVGIKLSKMLLAAISTVNTVLLPRISNYNANGLIEKSNQLITKAFNYVLLVAIPLITFSTYNSKDIIHILSGEGYELSSQVFVASLPILIIVGIGGILCYLILIPQKREKYVSFAQSSGVIADLVLNAILIPLYGCIGAALSTTATELYICIFSFTVVIRNHEYNFKQLTHNSNVIKIIICNFIFLIMLIIGDLLNLNLDSLLNMGIYAIVTFFIYGLVLVLLKENITITICRDFVKKVGNSMLH